MGILIFCAVPTYWFFAKSDYQTNQQDNSSITKIETPKPKTRPFQEVYVSPKELKDFLREEVVKYGLDYQKIYNVIDCESGFNENAYNPIETKSGHSYGVAQFMKPSWDYFNKLRGTNKDYLNPFHQIDMMLWAFKNGYSSHWDCFTGKR